jgi:hypothetical protein
MAAVSYQTKTGYYGLHIQDTLEGVLSGDNGKGKSLPTPRRPATTEAESMTRAYLMESAKKYTDRERALLEYRASGGELPEGAAADGPSPAGQDDTFARIERHHEAMQDQAAVEEAKKTLKKQREEKTKQARAEHLRAAYGPNKMDPMIEAHHEQLEEAGVGHFMAKIQTMPPRRAFQAPPEQMVSAGFPQVPEFPTFEALNRGEVDVRPMSSVAQSKNMTYERVRNFVVSPTWSS